MRKNIRLWTVCLWAAIALLASGSIAMAQDFRATLTGIVTDPSGAVIKNAEVTATNVDSGTSYTGKTTDKGVYYIPYVLPGTYTVTSTANGFKTAQQDKVLLLASQTFTQNFKLDVGSESEKVIVTTAPAELETSTGSGGTVIDQRTLQAVPLNGASAYSLIGTTPGSQFTTTTFGQSGNHGTTGWDTSASYTIGGGIVGNNQFTLNGVNITSQFSYNNHSAGEWSVSPNLDSVEEVNVMTTTYDARYGRTSGGTVNTVSKSGGNQFHGNARYAYQGAFMNANTYQNNLTGTPKQGEIQNQFWITGGGPVIKNKLFFYFGFEGYRQSLAGSELFNTAPAYLRPGFNGATGVNFNNVQTYDSAQFPSGIPIYQPGTATCADGGAVTACNSQDVVQQQFPNNSIPAASISPTALAILNYVPLPNIASAANNAKGNNYLAIEPDKYDYNQPQIRVDYNLTDKTKLYSYFLYWKGTENRVGNGLSGIAANGNINHIRQTWVATQDLTHVFSPTLIGDFKASFNRFYEQAPDGNLNTQTDPSTIGLTMPLPPTTAKHYLPEFGISDGWGTGLMSGSTIFGNNLNNDVTNTFTFDVDFTKTAGAHTLEFGGEIDEFQYGGTPYGGGHPNGDFGFNSSWTQLNPHNGGCYYPGGAPAGANPCASQAANGSALASFYLGQPDGGGIDWYPSIMEGYPVYAGYFQDNWKVNSRLTLNLGIRYDVQRGLRERNNELNRGLCLTCVNPLTNEAAYQANVANGANQAAWSQYGISASSLQTVYGGIQYAGENGQSRDAYDTDWSDVGPRVGFAFVVDPKTVIRGGWGLMYSYGLEGGSSVGYDETTNFTSSLDGGNTPTNYFQTGNPFASGLLQPIGSSEGLLTAVGNGTQSVDFPNRKVPMEQIVSFGFQRELPGHIVLDARYAGNFTSRLRAFLWKNGTATRAQQEAAEKDNSIWTSQVPNPYYGVPGMDGPGQCGTSTTVQAIALILPYSQYCTPGGYGLVGQYNAPIGRNWYDGLEVKLTRRVTNSAGKGVSFNVSYTYSKTMSRDGYENGWPYQDAQQQHVIAGSDRTHILSATTVWDLPIGQGGLLFATPNPLVSRIVSGWTLSSVFNAQSGTPVGLNTGQWYTCPNQSFRPTHGTSVGSGRWLNNENNAYQNCWQGIPSFGLMYLPGSTTAVRNPTIPTLDLSLQKSTKIWRDTTFQLRLDAFNSLNSVLFGGPDNNPGDGPAVYTPGSGWSGFGTVGAQQQNFPRILQVGGNFVF